MPFKLGIFFFFSSNVLVFNRIIYWVLSQEKAILGRLPILITSYLWWLPLLRRRITLLILCQSWQASISSNVVMRLLWIHKLLFTSLCSLLLFESISFLPSPPPFMSGKLKLQLLWSSSCAFLVTMCIKQFHSKLPHTNPSTAKIDTFPQYGNNFFQMTLSKDVKIAESWHVFFGNLTLWCKFSFMRCRCKQN